jgi:BA14K-like protein
MLRLSQGNAHNGRRNMSNAVRGPAAAVVLAAGIASFASTAPATPVAHALAIKNAVPATVETVQWRRGWGGFGAGLVAGAIIGGALSSPYYGYGPYPYYYAPPPPPPPPVYYGAPAYGAPVAGDAVAYCMQRFRSYDRRSGTYLGYDGLRHPCP